MSKKSWYLLISVLSSLGIATTGVAVTVMQVSPDGSQYLGTHPIAKVAATGIATCGSADEIKNVQAAATILIDSDIALDAVTRSQLDDLHFVYSQEAKDRRRSAVGAVWATDSALKRFNDIQSGLEFSSTDKSLVEPMQQGRFVVASWHGVCSSATSAQAVLFGHEVEVTSSKSKDMPDEYIQVELKTDSSGAWKISGISHRQVTGG